MEKLVICQGFSKCNDKDCQHATPHKYRDDEDSCEEIECGSHFGIIAKCVPVKSSDWDE